MTKFLDKSFSTYAPGDRRYADNWERTFGKMKPAQVSSGSPAQPDALLEAARAVANEWMDLNWPSEDWKKHDSLVALLLRFRGFPGPV